MSQCVEKPLCFALKLFALASVSLLYSRTVECAETKLTLKLNTTRNLNITQNFTHNEPWVLPVHRLCSGQNESYCINGVCSFHENINTLSCTCHSGFMGKRCELRDLTSGVSTYYNLEEVIALSCGVILLLACVCVLGCCCCYRKCSSKPAPPYKHQESSV
ncbi:hypothetical protein PHYPO_G00099150 [Pangasianodon hypophthalmus]|uniref:EGF-like domain-containing protein n=1 Tax=Pangasianodon hypophthalmus TaxID=310915 RepID=A0A5N5LC26_PANHP|nr:epigen isoform X1 [Pangasianodon hypophthalmus]KAB5540200.1 hypothetical protein PHYPO_G00099150 [Pangasianodon hypophthalmus]